MSVQSAVTDRPLSPEHFQRGDWKTLLQLSRVERVAKLCSARNPLSGTPLDAVWGFCRSTGKLRFFDAPRAREAAGSDLTECRNKMGRFANWLPAVATLKSQKVTIDDLCSSIERLGGADQSFLGDARQNYGTAWRQFTNMTVFGVYDRNIFRRSPAVENAALDTALIQFFDYYAHRERYWSSIPLDFIAESHSDSAAAYLKIFCDPRLFDPQKPVTDDMFVWPWQRCLSRDPAGHISYRQIKTTSLVLDLRNSTTAMNLFKSPEIYADFISEVVEAGRAIVVREGGFFDKETGDGIVAHFCDFSLSNGAEIGSQVQRAYNASRDLGRSILAICDKYQQFLELGILGLAPSVGLHTGGAVWMVVDQQIRAMGSSVVTAARLCAVADPSEGLMSNGSFVELGSILNPSELSRFRRKGVGVKEHDPKAALFGHAFGI